MHIRCRTDSATRSASGWLPAQMHETLWATVSCAGRAPGYIDFRTLYLGGTGLHAVRTRGSWRSMARCALEPIASRRASCRSAREPLCAESRTARAYAVAVRQNICLDECRFLVERVADDAARRSMLQPCGMLASERFRTANSDLALLCILRLVSTSCLGLGRALRGLHFS